ncbi:DUF4349 domain-containing protein [Leucobacter luti]|uniref:DUF4349 domain-containing protein n=1 Tax=Leucobacter luti TaxID=340320 RepID=UPI003D04E9C9
MKQRRTPILLALAAVLAIAPLSACSGVGPGLLTEQGSSLPSQVDSGSVPDLPAPDQGGARSLSPEQAPGAASAESSADTPAVERAIIKTGVLGIEVGNTEEAADRVTEIADELGGTVESRRLSSSGAGGSTSASVTIRVPVDRFDEAFEALGEVGRFTVDERSATDVTAERADLSARVDALQTSVDRLTGLMKDAKTTADLLDAESMLSQRQQELDGLRAQLKSLEGQADEATISITLQTRSALPGGGPSNFGEGFIAGLNSLAATGSGALVVLGVLLPWLVIAAVIALAVVLIVRAASRRRRQRVAAAAGAATAVAAGAADPAQADPAPTDPAPTDPAPTAPAQTAPAPAAPTPAAPPYAEHPPYPPQNPNLS